MDRATLLDRLATLPPDAPVATAEDERRWVRAAAWSIAATIVGLRYIDSAIDALPVQHPEHGWDRFLLTRRVSCQGCAGVSADEFGQLSLRGEGAPRLLHNDGSTAVALGPLLADDPAAALAAIEAHLPAIGLTEDDHTTCWHTLATEYPRIYGSVADLLRTYPQLEALREVFVDAEFAEGTMHPLHLHTGGHALGEVYDWWALLADEYVAFVHVDGRQSIYQSSRGTWSTVAKQLDTETDSRMAERIRGWLRLEAEPAAPEID
ncbi:MAG TPA: hypothetical protein VIL85_05865 [Thermomicrobiales bacterium]